MKYVLLTFFVFALLTACHNPLPTQNYQAEIAYTRQLIEKRTEIVAGVRLDSIWVADDTLYTNFTDSQAKYFNQIRVKQQFAVLFQDFVHIQDAPFHGFRMDIQLPKRNADGYVSFIRSSMPQLRAMLHMFTNPPFTNMVNGISQLNQEHPKIDLIDQLNTVLAQILFEDKVVKQESFFGEDYVDIAAQFLADCEKRKRGYFTEAIVKATNRLAASEHVGEEVAQQLLRVFQTQCEQLQSLNPQEGQQVPSSGA
ncbi:MAG: hypothetical protein AAF206_22965 [Bacteroidota bacterium]